MPIIRERCARCNQINVVLDESAPYVCLNKNCDSDFERLHPAWRTQEEQIVVNSMELVREIVAPRTGCVYYLRFGDRIKIGTTVNLPQRLKGIFHDEVLAVEQGGYQLESRRHSQFAGSLVKGQREWFYLTPDLRLHINTLRSQNGEPIAAAERWAA